MEEEKPRQIKGGILSIAGEYGKGIAISLLAMVLCALVLLPVILAR